MPRKAGASPVAAAPAEEPAQTSPPLASIAVAPPTTKKVGAQFNIVETRELLLIVAEVKPIGGQGWSEVERQFNQKAANGVLQFKVRAANSLKSRFQRFLTPQERRVGGHTLFGFGSIRQCVSCSYSSDSREQEAPDEPWRRR
jgi:hypothetical protein